MPVDMLIYGPTIVKMAMIVAIKAKRALYTPDEYDYAVCIIGSPRSGKSSMLNKLGGIFCAGWNLHAGMTQGAECGISIINRDRILLINLPGIGEAGKLDAHLKALRRGLVQSDKIRLLFVVRLEFGSFNLADVTLMKTMLKSSLTGESIGVVFNHCCKDDMKHTDEHVAKLKEDTGYTGAMMSTFLERCSRDKLPSRAGWKLRILVGKIKPAKVELRSKFQRFWRKIFKARDSAEKEEKVSEVIADEELFAMDDDGDDDGDDDDDDDEDVDADVNDVAA